MREHRKAVEYDLLTKTNHSLEDVGSTLTWSALDSFVDKISDDSAIKKEIYPEQAEWSTVFKTNVILADLYDLLSQINNNIVAAAEGEASKKIHEYSRPWVKDENSDSKQIGSGALPAYELHEWIDKKRSG